MAFLLFVMTMMSIRPLWLQFGECASAPVMLPTSVASGQQLATLDPFTNSQDNLSLALFLRSENYLSLASLRRSQAHRYDINTTTDFCEIDVGTVGVWNWRSGCAKISVGSSCSAALSKDGDLQILDGSSVAWSTDTAGKNVQFVELLNSGDLILTNSSNVVIWKSSDHIAKEECAAEGPASAPTASSPGAATPASSPGPEGHPTPSSTPSPASSPSSTPSSPPSSPASSPSPEGYAVPSPTPAAATTPSYSSPLGSSSGPSVAEAPAEGPAPASHSSASRLSVTGLKNSVSYQIIVAILVSASCATLFLNERTIIII